mgnify:CR=1 FL=1
MIRFLVLTIFPVLVTYAAVSDLRTRRIPNWLNLSLFLSFFPVALLAGMPLEMIGWSLVAFAVTLAAGFALFAFNVIGGGDAKMIPAVAVWIGWGEPLVAFLYYTALIGGLMAVGVLLWRVISLEVGVWTSGSALKRIFNREMNFPYGVPIAAGALAAFPQSWWSGVLFG